MASSRGRGIFLAKTPDEVQSHISSDEQVVVSRYIADPLCIDGHKCDIRIYVAVTSFNPLIIYLYEEGLVRIATVRYSTPTSENLWNPCMHLCNYSINKYHTDYIKSNNASLEGKLAFEALSTDSLYSHIHIYRSWTKMGIGRLAEAFEKSRL